MTASDARRRAIGRPAFVLAAALTVIGVAFLSALGAWQLRRLGEKEALIARIAAGLAATPEPAPGPSVWPTLSSSDIDYRPLTVTGRFDHGHEVHVYGVVERGRGAASGVGYFILTPLETTAGWVVIVNRGFVPDERKNPASRAAGQLEGIVTVTGIARRPDLGNAFTPKPDVARNVWFNRDPAAIAAAIGQPPERVAPFTLDARFDPNLPGGLPQGGETVVSFPNNHLQYAVTWFGLAAALAGVALAGLWRWRKGRAEKPEG